MNPLADVTIIRSTFSMAGQTLAIHVVGDPIADNNGVFYVYGDHLGSTALLTYGLTAVGDDHAAAGDPVPNTLARYTPFGDWRTEPTAGLTDRGFTGHRSNNKGAADIGLIYMNARFYLPGVGRFVSADSLVPDPANPQSFNRYSYVENRPLNFTDPSGHGSICSQNGLICSDGAYDDGTPPWTYSHSPQTQLAHPCSGSNECLYISAGVWHVSMYIYALESDAATDSRYFGKTNEFITTSVCYNSGTGCEERTFPYRFLYGAEGVIQQGTGITNDGRYIHPGSTAGHWVYRDDGSKDYFVPTDVSIYWGAGRVVVPHVSVAAGPSYNPGTALFVPDLAHAPNGGYFVVGDTGGGIADREMDIFVGNGLAAYYANKSVYFGPVGTWESADLETFLVLVVNPQDARIPR